YWRRAAQWLGNATERESPNLLARGSRNNCSNFASLRGQHTKSRSRLFSTGRSFRSRAGAWVQLTTTLRSVLSQCLVFRCGCRLLRLKGLICQRSFVSVRQSRSSWAVIRPVAEGRVPRYVDLVIHVLCQTSRHRHLDSVISRHCDESLARELSL